MAVHDAAYRGSEDETGKMVERINNIKLLETPLSTQQQLCKNVYRRLERLHVVARLLDAEVDDDLLPVTQEMREAIELSMQDVARLI